MKPDVRGPTSNIMKKLHAPLDLRPWTLAVLIMIALRLPCSAATPLTSSSQLFVVSGFHSADALEIAAWADDVAERVARELGRALPDMSGRPIRIVARTEDEYARGRVTKGQGWSEGYLQQQLTVVNPPLADQEDILEAVCWLLANRHVIARQSVSQRNLDLGATPDWFSDGLGQSLFPELRMRNAEAVKLRWEIGRRMSVAAVLGKGRLPAGRWNEKYVCGLFVGWLLQGQERAGLLDQLFDTWAAGNSVGSALLVQAWEGTDDETTLESRWDDWVARQSRIERRVGVVTEAHIRRLKELTTDAHAELASMAVETDIKKLAAGIAQRTAELQTLATGRPEDFCNVVQSYTTYLVATLDRSGEGAPPLVRLDAADQVLRAYLQSVETRWRYLDAVELRLAAGGTNQHPHAAQYLDRLESGLR